jgi:hypothetical protein
MMRDEADVAYHTVCHMAEEGLAGIIVADNLSTDATRGELERAAAEVAGSCQVVIVPDLDPAYYQSQKMTALAELAHNDHGAEWIVPFDADELWLGVDRVGVVLAALDPRTSVATAALTHHFATRIDPAGDNPFLTMGWRQAEAAPLSKAAFRWRPGAVILQGNHGVRYADGVVPRSSPALTIRHFPYRSYEQFERKARTGAAAYAATALAETEGAHWRQYGAILERLGTPGLREVWDQWYHHLAPIEQGMVFDPAPFRRWNKVHGAGASR